GGCGRRRPQEPRSGPDGGRHGGRPGGPCHGGGSGEDPGRWLRRLQSHARRPPGATRGGCPLPAAGAAEDRVMSEQSPKPSRASESLSKSSKPYTDILQLNQELVQNLQGLVDEHEARKKEVDELRFAHDQAQAEIARLQEELRHANQRDSDRHEQLRQLEQERVGTLGAMSALLHALRSAVDRYLQQGRKAA